MLRPGEIVEARRVLVAVAGAGIIVLVATCDGDKSSEDDSSCPPYCGNTFAPANSGSSTAQSTGVMGGMTPQGGAAGMMAGGEGGVGARGGASGGAGPGVGGGAGGAAGAGG